MAAVTQKRARRLSVFAIVAALHAGVCWLLLEATRPFKIGTAASSLELIYLALGVPERPAKGPAQAPRPQSLVRPNVANPPKQSRPLSQPSTAAPGEEDNAIHPPIDWANELNRTARESASGESAPKPREFGAPHVAPTPPAKRPEFGWSHSRTHRVETGPGSLAIIHLGDHCVIAFTPLPVTVCTPGKTEANGDLFKHMLDPPQDGDWKDPP